MKLFTFSKRWKMRGDALVNEVCYYAKRDIAAGEELLCFDGRWVGLPVPTELAPTTSTLKLPCDAENPRISYGKTWWSSRGIHDATAAPQTQLLLPLSSVAGEWFWMVDHEFHDDDNSDYHNDIVTTIHFVMIANARHIENEHEHDKMIYIHTVKHVYNSTHDDHNFIFTAAGFSPPKRRDRIQLLEFEEPPVWKTCHDVMSLCWMPGRCFASSMAKTVCRAKGGVLVISGASNF